MRSILIINLYVKSLEQIMAQTRINDFEIKQKLGEGSYSQVYKVVRKSDQAVYAMKKVKLFDLKEKEKENALNEVRILASFNHPNIISFKDAFLDDNRLCIIMEYANGGDLQQRIKEAQKNGLVPEKEIWKALFQITKGLKKLHDMKIVHRDLKAANIFISDGVYKLGDLNVSKITKRGLAYTQTGTPYYASPEVWRNDPYNQQSDIWSLGCVIYEYTALKLPFKAPDLQALCNKVQRGLFEALPRSYSRDLQSMITQLIQVLPTKRLNCNQILNSPLLLKNYAPGMEKSQIQQNELLQTIQLPRNYQQIKLPKANYEQDDDFEKPRLGNQRAQSALPGQIKERNLSPINGNKDDSYANYPSAPRKKGDPSTPISQPSQRVKSGIPTHKEKLVQEQLKLELKREQEKLQAQRQKQQLQLQLSNQPSQHQLSRPETGVEALRQQIVKQHKLEEIKPNNKPASLPQTQQAQPPAAQQQQPIPPSRQSFRAQQPQQQAYSSVGNPGSAKPSARDSVSKSPQPQQGNQNGQQQAQPQQQQQSQQANYTQQQQGRPEEAQKQKQEPTKKERVILSAQPLKQSQGQQENEPNNEFIFAGLKNVNPQSIQSILCQPVLLANENPFPTRAKVQSRNGPQSAQKKESDSTPMKDNYQHFFPYQDSEFSDKRLQQQIKQ